MGYFRFDYWKETFFAIAFLILVCLFIWGTTLERAREEDCSITCFTKKSRLIDGACHCATDSGWEKQK